jgi:PKD repeat protein
MKQQLAVFAAGILTCLSLNGRAQEQHCFTTEVYNALVRQHPELLAVQQRLETQMPHDDAHTLAVQQRTSGTVRIIPLVFHIVHNYGPENISDEQVFDQVRILNEDFRLLNPDTSLIVPAFKSIAADCEIEFRLASIDPNGNCTNGIDRIVSPLTVNAADNAKLNPWPQNMYLNIWVVRSLQNSGAAAYAYYPGTAPAGKDGVISIHSYIGSIGTGSPGRSRVITHEIGHCLNLQHVWGNTNNPGVACGDDQVSDTPVTEGWTSCNLSGATCGNVVDNVQNYMEYSYCDRMFTLGQKNRMQAALRSSFGGRNNLWTASNLNATGALATATCAPVADFLCNSPQICAGSSTTFRDMSWNGKPTAWSWSFPGGTPSVSSDSIPVVTYTSAGTYNVSLTVTNSGGSGTVTKNTLVHVGGAPVNPIPYAEGFETAGSFPGLDGQVINNDGGNTWTRVTNAGATGTASVMINNFSGNTPGETDDFITGGFDLSAFYVPMLTFKVAYAERDTSLNDLLTVAASDDCGTTWVTRYTKNGGSLKTVPGIRTSFFVPTATQWRQDSVIFPTMRYKPNVRFRFQNRSDGGNNIYIDDINITILPAGIEDAGDLQGFAVYPNPSAGSATVRFSTQTREELLVQLLDVTGREVERLSSGTLAPGLHKFHTTASLPEGLYFVRISGGAGTKNHRLVVTR